MCGQSNRTIDAIDGMTRLLSRQTTRQTSQQTSRKTGPSPPSPLLYLRSCNRESKQRSENLQLQKNKDMSKYYEHVRGVSGSV